MMTQLHFARFAAVTFILALGAVLLPATASAQRVSVQDMQAQIDALTFPYDEPAAQVRTALDLLPTFQEAVAKHYRQTGDAARDRQAAGLSASAADTSTDFIGAVDIVDGSIAFTFANYADATISGLTLYFTPYESYDRTITWRCGDAPAPVGMSLLGTQTGGRSAAYMASTVPQNLQPSPCVLQSQIGSSDEIIRAQVLEPFPVLENFKAAVEAAGIALGAPNEPRPPIDREEAGLTRNEDDTFGRYYESIEITNGVITVVYGREIHPDAYGYDLTLVPYESSDGTIIWQCGYAFAPSGAALMGTSYGGVMAVSTYPSMPERYLPFECREN